MPSEAEAPRNWFDRDGQAYARFRPDYPPELARFLADSSPSRDMAVDVGCGNGQFTKRLADEFSEVIGCDPSADQIANAQPREGLHYICAPAERIPLPDGCASLVTAAQAAHWFDLPAFYAEARRIARPGTIIALVSYGVLQLDDDLQARFDRFYHDEIGPYWPPGRQLVDSGYLDIGFPFAELDRPGFEIRMSWQLDQFLGYVSTWSAVRRLSEAGEDAILAAFARDIAALWGEAARVRSIAWPLNMRIGRTSG